MKVEKQYTKNIQDSAKAILKGKFTVISAYKRQEKSQINNLSLHLKKQKKNKQSTKLVEGNKDQSRNK